MALAPPIVPDIINRRRRRRRHRPGNGSYVRDYLSETRRTTHFAFCVNASRVVRQQQTYRRPFVAQFSRTNKTKRVRGDNDTTVNNAVRYRRLDALRAARLVMDVDVLPTVVRTPSGSTARSSCSSALGRC